MSKSASVLALGAMIVLGSAGASLAQDGTQTGQQTAPATQAAPAAQTAPAKAPRSESASQISTLRAQRNAKFAELDSLRATGGNEDRIQQLNKEIDAISVKIRSLQGVGPEGSRVR